MISKWLITNLIFIMFKIQDSDAKRGSGGIRSRTGSSNDSSSNGAAGALGTIIMILLCGGGIGWRIFRCCQREQHRKRDQQQIDRLIDMHEKLLQISPVDHLNQTNLPLNETDLSSNRPNNVQFILIPLPNQPFDDSSEQMATNQEKCAVVIPIEGSQPSPHIN